MVQHIAAGGAPCRRRRETEVRLAGDRPRGILTLNGMEILRNVVILVHLVGFAVLFGAWVVEAVGRRNRITRLMNPALGISLISGLALSAPWGLDHDLNYTKIAIKLVVLLVIGALLGIGSARQKRTESVPSAIFWLIGILTLLNAGLAVIWH
jgi:hypothetical protein